MHIKIVYTCKNQHYRPAYIPLSLRHSLTWAAKIVFGIAASQIEHMDASVGYAGLGSCSWPIMYDKYSLPNGTKYNIV